MEKCDTGTIKDVVGTFAEENRQEGLRVFVAGGSHSGNDCVYVDEVCILPSVGVLGDVDGDGTVTISDALMIMRNAMQLLEFTPAQAAAADMDGDGLITVEDALTALRAAITVR